MTTYVSHELQHLLDRNTQWWTLIQYKLEDIVKSNNSDTPSKGLTLVDLEYLELGYGLKEVRKYFTELNAFSRNEILQKEVERIYPELIERWTLFKQENAIKTDFKPIKKVVDREYICRAYIWGGNLNRFWRALKYVRQDTMISEALLQANFL